MLRGSSSGVKHYCNAVDDDDDDDDGCVSMNTTAVEIDVTNLSQIYPCTTAEKPAKFESIRKFFTFTFRHAGFVMATLDNVDGACV